ncbi:MAG: Flp pilus assembly complex ATPase component TadA [Deltaproteobacteria bacterium]|nr:Flp pilus assembly complex ATPase component TadA [Deltaproteobacteria bacterium]
MSMFSGSVRKPVPRPGKTTSAPRRAAGSGIDPNDTSIEGTLKHVLHEVELNEVGSKNHSSTLSEEDKSQSDAPLVRLVNSLLAEAARMNCSDIHIEPFESMLRVRYRVDGALREIQRIPFKLSSAIASRLKIMADLDICEKRLPQDGSFKFNCNGVEAEFRLSTLPSVFGEKIVLRIMAAAAVNNDLSKLAIPAGQLRLIRDAINKPDGLVLVTGPTGSGKTTTLYAALNELNDISVSVFTAEDPVEGKLPGVTQCQANSGIGYNFASILRSLLRQDPDVILVGEIRDQETAEISIKASLTGHLVLSTLHTNCSVSTISRLINMGIQPYLITSSINCIVAQRLVRKICQDCKQEFSPPRELTDRLGTAGSQLQGATLWHGKGCPKCFNSGYRGRAPVYEVLVLSDELRRLILAGASREELRRVAKQEGMLSLREAGLHLVREGVSTIEEVLGATNEEETVVTESPTPTRPPKLAPPVEAPPQVASVLAGVDSALAAVNAIPTSDSGEHIQTLSPAKPALPAQSHAAPKPPGSRWANKSATKVSTLN